MQSESYEPTRKLGPGERIDPTGQVLHSAAWLSGLRMIPDPPPCVCTVRVAISVASKPGDETTEAAGDLRVAASSAAHALERAARRLGFPVRSSGER